MKVEDPIKPIYNAQKYGRKHFEHQKSSIEKNEVLVDPTDPLYTNSNKIGNHPTMTIYRKSIIDH